MIETTCERCGKPCRGGEGNPNARLLKRAQMGYCADCALTAFLKETEPLGTLIEGQGKEILRDSHIRAQIAQLLIVGKSDANIAEIDIERVITHWGLPFNKRRKAR